ncbi:hypothetical protein E2C01_083330 [Portunus trituberculatus]|uniref:Uncharacterized protein n=1 Tax=Portunus trituberculatus TaxID=210409 RepID=A0A5B7J6A5_PORTR|nr:hypothetical protein [Portunus trituberculatus]
MNPAARASISIHSCPLFECRMVTQGQASKNTPEKSGEVGFASPKLPSRVSLENTRRRAGEGGSGPLTLPKLSLFSLWLEVGLGCSSERRVL